MNEELFKNDFDTELSPEESAAIDRILAGISAEDDRRVDYDGMLRRIKAAAGSEGIVVFPSDRAKKRKGLVKRLALGAATAAAVFVVGLAAMLVLRTVLDDDAEAPVVGTEAYFSEKPVKDAHDSTPVKHTAKATSAPKDNTKVTNAPAAPVTEPTSAPEEPSLSVLPDLSPFPTEFPMRGGSAGYVELESFETAPEDAADLVPADLPPCMNVMPVDDPLLPVPNLSAEAAGADGGNEYTYTCTVVSDLDVELEVGVAMYKYDEESGHITYIWRITDEAYLVADFDGFSLEQAQELLTSLAEFPERVDGYVEYLPAA